MEYIGDDPRNETTFIINDMKASLDSLDEPLMKKKKESRSKFARVQKEKEYGRKMSMILCIHIKIRCLETTFTIKLKI